MRKNLLSFCLLAIILFVNHGFAQQSKQASVLNQPAKALPFGKHSPKGNSQAVITTTTSTCMSVNLPVPASWTLSNYGTGTPIFSNGFVNGPNMYGDKEKAMFFDVSASANTMITQVYVAFDHAYSATPTKTVGIKVYNGTLTGGPTGAAIGSSTIAMSTIMTDVSNNQYSLIIFPTPVNLPASKKFFVSVDVSGLQWGAIKDSLSIISNTSPQGPVSVAWEKSSTNIWDEIYFGWGVDISLLIHPFLTQAPLVATMSMLPGNTICEGQSINYNSAGSTAGTYEWYFGAASTPTATGATAATTYTTAGTYTTSLIVEDACGSLKLAQNTITVKPNPTVNASPSSTTVCNGTSITLSGGGASTYTWSGGVPNAAPFTASSTTNYTVTGTAVNGCTNSAVASVVTNSNPAVAANASSTLVCSGNNLTLTGGGASTYTWSGGASNAVPFAPSATNTYTVIGTAANSCTASAMVSVTVAPNPTVNASPSSTTVCNGANVTLNGGGATTYTWTGGVSNGVTFTASSTSNYTVTGADANGCIGTAVANLSVNPNPVVTAASTPTSVCSGGSVTMTGGGASTYTWTGGVTDGVAFVPASSSNYTVSGTDVNGCMGQAVYNLTVNPNPTIAATPTSTSVCSGGSVTLTGGGASTYTWTGGVTDGVAFVPSSSSNYTVNGTDANGCTGMATASVNVNLNPVITASPSSTTVCSGSSLTLNGNGASTYTWTGGVSDGVAFVPSGNNTYTVNGTDANGCMGSAQVSVTVVTCTGIDQVSKGNAQFNVYPNPNSGIFTVLVSDMTESVSVEIYDGIGKLIQTEKLVSTSQNVVTNLSTGIYFIKLIENNQTIATRKLIIH